MYTPADGRNFLRQMVHAYNFTSAVYAAVVLEIPDLLEHGPRTAASVAEERGTHPDATMRLLRFLVSLDLAAVDDQGRYSNAGLGKYLVRRHPESMADEVLMFAGAENYRAWGNLVESVKTGRCAFDVSYGAPLFEYLGQHPDSAERFHRSWHEITVNVGKQLAEAYDFSSHERVIDVGGGYGVMLASVLARHPHLRGWLFDLDYSVRGAQDNFAAKGVADRAVVLTGDATIEVPRVASLCMLKSVIHLCDDEKAVAILKQCAEAVPAGGKVLVLERVIPDGPEFHWSKIVDMTMLVMTGGRERTRSDYATLFSASNWRLVQCVPLASGFSIVEGERV